MTLTTKEFDRAASLEASRHRLLQLQTMNHRELRELLLGDPAEAATWVQSAAEFGLPAAQLRLGRMLLEGVGVERNPHAAFRWFVRAADSDDAEALNMTGRCYENGWGVAEDLNFAAACYRSSAAAGNDWGQYNFGNLLFDGRGVERDPELAVYWYRCAANQSHGRAMNLLGRCAEEGWGCKRCAADAADWYRRSAETGYFRGQFNYAVVLLEQGSEPLAAEWLRRALAGADAGLRRAIAEILAAARDRSLVAIREDCLRII